MINIYFTDDEHGMNYEEIKRHYKRTDFEKNGTYRSVCYIAAVPEIFKCFNLSAQSGGPFDWLWHHLEGREDPSGTTAPLGSQTWALCHIALSLWNGRPCDLSDIQDLDPSLYLVVLQALDLRRRRPSFDYSQYQVKNIDVWYGEQIFRKQPEGDEYTFIKGYADLTKGQQELLKMVHAKHNQGMGDDLRDRYKAEHISQVTWVPKEKCLHVHFDDRNWWHYGRDQNGILEWY